MISTSEPGTTLACSLDGAPFAPCSPPVAYIALTAGVHVFDVRAVDPSGATAPTSAVLGLIVVPPLPPPGTDPP